ncbi:glycoside hydrolase family 2 protein [Maribellus sediminis]|uniref:glycoside hydrolase family 2 protein n=1 Tax=Maribellus sediminis TaxID=2696285 RepID=UPI0014306359|nr:glycoside hydrolase family 2 TIM barrel-domain containing protein [Maribellus sediminis]
MKLIKKILLLSLLNGSVVLFAQEPELADLLQNIESREKISLDGNWDVIIDPLENGYYNHWLTPKKEGYNVNKKMKSPSDLIEYNFDTSPQLTVPGDWNTQMEKLYYYEGTIWYKKDFSYTPEADEQVYLYFEAVNYEAMVYLNGELLGTHIGGYTPFQFDISNKIKNGNNFIVVKVDNKRKRENVPTLNQDWWNYGGITRSVHLISMPVSHIADYSVQLAKGKNDTIEGWVKVKNSAPGQTVRVTIPELNQDVTLPLENGKAAFSLEVSPTLWEPDNPKLYEVLIETGSDHLKDNIGFRTIETRGSSILLNGKNIFLKGISIHEEAPFKTGRVTSKEECLILLNWAKELGCNFIRLAHYPHNETMVREAEKMGLMVWSEIPVYWTILFDNPDTYTNAENQLVTMISRDKNRAAIVLWSLANETPESDARYAFISKLAQKVRSLDQTRLITAALDSQTEGENGNIIEDRLGEVIDVIGINSYCGWYGGSPESCATLRWASKFDKPMIMSEVGGGALYGLHGETNERWTEEYQADVYLNNIEMIRHIDFLAGISPWILMDFRSPRRSLNRIQDDFNRKGLISEQGRKKQAFFILQDFYLNENNQF